MHPWPPTKATTCHRVSAAVTHTALYSWFLRVVRRPIDLKRENNMGNAITARDTDGAPFASQRPLLPRHQLHGACAPASLQALLPPSFWVPSRHNNPVVGSLINVRSNDSLDILFLCRPEQLVSFFHVASIVRLAWTTIHVLLQELLPRPSNSSFQMCSRKLVPLTWRLRVFFLQCLVNYLLLREEIH